MQPSSDAPPPAVEGKWTGSTGEARPNPFSFQVVGSTVSNVTLSGNFPTNGPPECAGGFSIGSGAVTAIVDDAFVFTGTFVIPTSPARGYNYTLTGHFLSSASAAGSMHVSFTNPFCANVVDLDTTWSASRQP